MGERHALGAGYRYVRVEGYVARFGTKSNDFSVPLKLFWSPGRRDNFTAGSERGEKDALASGYHYVRTEGFIRPISTTVSPAPSTKPKIIAFARSPNSSRYAIGEQVTLQWKVQCEPSCDITLFGGINGGLFKLTSLPRSGSKAVSGLVQDTGYKLIVRSGIHTVTKTTSIRTWPKPGSEIRTYYFKTRCPSNITPCYVTSQAATSSSEAKKVAQRSATNCTVEAISQEVYWKGCR